MFNGGADEFEFEQLIRTTTTSLPLSSTNNNTFHHLPPPFNQPNYNNTCSNSHSQTNIFHPPILLPHNDSQTTTFNSSINFQIQTHDQLSPLPLIESSWTNEEVLTLFKIRSTIDNCFPDHLTWDHVSRKLAEFGFKKSAEKCKEKFENENISFYKINNGINNYPPFVSELQGLYRRGDDEKQNLDKEENIQHEEENSRDLNIDIVVTKQCDDDHKVMEKSKDKMRKRKRFEMFKCFCESVVNKMMEQQEEIHNKLLEDMLKRDQEKLAREEAWKNQEMERMDMMAKEQAISDDRQSSIIQFLNKYLSTQNPNINPSKGNNNLHYSSTPSSNVIAQNPSSSDKELELLQVPSTSSNNSNNNPQEYSNSTSTTLVVPTMENLEEKRRWPRDEVLALIKLKSTCLNSNNNTIEEKEGNYSNKGPLWERISEGMLEMGYKRRAKRCKEKWENINKYFKKTKDVVNKKRSLDSRTCPYFHQLNSLYNHQQQQEKLISHPPSQLENVSTSNSAGQIDDQQKAKSPIL